MTHDDDLFRPTLGTTTRDPALPRPWRVGSQLWVAFFGGCFAVLAIAWLNVHRLGGDWRGVGLRMVGATAVVWGLVTAVVAVVWSTYGADGDVRRYIRWGYRAGAIVLHLLFARIQTPLDRRYVATHDEAYASLWGPGLIAVLVGGGLQAVATAAVILPVIGLAVEEP